MQRDQIAMLLRQHGLARVSDDLLALAAPTIWVHATPADETAVTVGASKLGGQPDLPAGSEWPTWHEPMAFLGQFNLAETTPYDVERALPAQGLLSFFYGTNGEPLYADLWGLPEPARSEATPDFPDRRSWRVFYLPGDRASLIRRSIPEAVNPGGRFPNRAVRLSTEWTIPEAERWETASLSLTTTEHLALVHIEAAINGGTWDEPGTRLLGHPHNLGVPTLLECDVAERGLRNVRWDQTTLEQERTASQRWRLLLQLTGGREVPYNWGGSGILHFCIERAALTARDFGHTWVNMQLL